MKIAVSSTGKILEDKVDQRFGRCPYFLIVEIENKKIKKVKAVENKSANQLGAAGISAAQLVGDEGAEAVLTGNLGPNASDVLTQLDIKAYKASGKVKDAVNDFIEGSLSEISELVAPHTGLKKKKQSKTEKILFPLLENKGMDSEISSHFGHAPFLGVYELETKKLTIKENTLDHSDPEKSPVDQIVEAFNPTIVFAQGIGGRAIMLFAEKGIQLKTGPYTKIKEVIENIDNLEDLTEGCGH